MEAASVISSNALSKQIVVRFEQSTRDKGALTKNMVLYEEQGNKMRKVYVSQQALLTEFGHLPKSIIVHVLNGDSEVKHA